MLAVSAGLAIVVAAAGYRQASEDSGRRLALALVLFVPTIPLGCFLWIHRDSVEFTAEKVIPRPGGALRLSEVSDVEPGRKAPGEGTAPVEGTFTSLEIAEAGNRPVEEQTGPKRTFTVRMPVRHSDCMELEARFGGGCGRPGSVLRGFVNFEVASARRAQPLSAEVRPGEARALELIETTARAQQAVPTEWNLASWAPRTAVTIQCSDGAPLAVRTSLEYARARCAHRAATYELTVEPVGGRPATLVLSELSVFTVHMSALKAYAIVSNARLSVDGSARTLPFRPAPISIQAPQDDSVDLTIEQSLQTHLNEVSLSANSASSVTTGSHELIPNWLEQHSDIAYFVLGILFASLIPALFDFALARRRYRFRDHE